MPDKEYREQLLVKPDHKVSPDRIDPAARLSHENKRKYHAAESQGLGSEKQ